MIQQVLEMQVVFTVAWGILIQVKKSVSFHFSLKTSAIKQMHGLTGIITFVLVAFSFWFWLACLFCTHLPFWVPGSSHGPNPAQSKSTNTPTFFAARLDWPMNE